MELVELSSNLMARAGVTEERPFGPDALVYKVIGKMFALVAWEAAPLQISLKCEPAHAEVLRGIYPAIKAGYHLNKRHWNTVTLDGTIPDDEIFEMIDISYDLVVGGLSRQAREALEQLSHGPTPPS